MRVILAIICAMLFFTTFSQTLNVNTEKTIISYNYVNENVTGNVEGFKAVLILNFDDISKSKVSGTVDATTLTSGNGLRDKHLQGKKYFSTKAFPKMTFESSSFEKTKNGYVMNGKMTIKDTSEEVVITFAKDDSSLVGKCKIYSNDFKIFEKKNREESEVLIMFEIVLN